MLEAMKGITNSQELVEAVKKNDLTEAKRLLKENPKAVNSVDMINLMNPKEVRGLEDVSILHIASHRSYVEMVKLICSQDYVNVE